MGTVKVTKTGETYTVKDANGNVFVGLSAEEAAAAVNLKAEELKTAVEAGKVGVAYFDEADPEGEDEEYDEEYDEDADEDEEIVEEEEEK